MYTYGITYYRIENEKRVPDTGLTVMLVRPGYHPATGLVADELGSSGHYSLITSNESDRGFYEIWDNRSGELAFSGKCCMIGPTDTPGIQPNSITTDLIANGAITASKIANGSLKPQHFSDLALKLQSIEHEIQNEYNGVGKETGATPALFGHDKTIFHVLEGSYKYTPIVILINQSNGHLFLNDISLNDAVATVTLGIGPNHGSKDATKYTLLVLQQQ